MATRRKSGSGDSKTTTRKPRTSGKTSAAARPRKSAAKKAEMISEAQTVGADIIPTGVISSEDAPSPSPAFGTLSPQSGARDEDAGTPADEGSPAIEPAAIKEHRVDQITPVVE